MLLAVITAHKPPVAFDNTTFDPSKRSPDSAAMVPYWDQTDTIIGGIKAMRLEKKTYLPAFKEEKDPDYQIRLDNTKFTNIYRDIVESLASKPFEEEITLAGEDIPAHITDFLEDTNGRGDNLTVFAATTFFNGINSAIDWIFIDYPTVDTSKIKTQADQKEAGIRPFWSHVLGRNVLTAETKRIAGKEVLTLVRILEKGTPDHIREFVRDDNGVVTWKLYEKKDNTTAGKTEWLETDTGVISIGVIPLVPFATGRRDGSTFKYFPSMQDAADLQIELYQQESALKFAKVMAAYPMLAGNGVKPDKDAEGNPKSITVGPMKVLYAPTDGSGKAGSWSFIEPAATSLTFLATDISETKKDLRELGRQPLTAQSGNLTVITTAVAAGKAKSAVGAWALGLKDALENALTITCLWLKVTDYKPEVNVYTEFDSFLDGNDGLEHLRKLREGGDLSQATLWEETQRRRVLSPEFDQDKELERLLKEVPGEDEDEDEDEE